MELHNKKLKVCLISAYSVVPPYGILSLASVLERGGIDVKVLDFTEKNVDERVISKGIADSDIVGLSAWSQPMIIEVAKITNMVREKTGKEKFLIWGGVHPTLFPKKVIEEFDLDAVCAGEGELTLLELVEALQTGSDITKVKGLWVRNNGEIIYTGPRNDILDVTALPGYAWHLIDVERYIKNIRLTLTREITLVESRGCPYQCTFCYAPRMFGSTWRGRTVDQIIDDVKFLKDQYGIRRFDFLDDLPFGGNRSKMLDFCAKIKQLDVEWSCDHRINLVDEELLSSMKDSGIWYIYFGVESGSPDMLNKVKKVGITPEKIIKVFDLCFKLGITTMAGFIIGMPGETEDDLHKSIELARKIKATIIRAATYVPYAGTELYEEALQKGFTPPSLTEDWGRLGSYAKVLNSLTDVPREKLAKVQYEMQRRSYRNSILFAVRHLKFNTLPYLILSIATSINPDSKIPQIVIKILRPFIWSYSKVYSLFRKIKRLSR